MIRTIKALGVLLAIMSIFMVGDCQGFTALKQDSTALKIVKSQYLEDNSKVYFLR